MIATKKRLIAATREIAGLTVLHSSGKAALQKFNLPLLTFDYGDFQHNPLTQDGKNVKVDPAYTMTLGVKEISDEELQDDELEKWWDLVIDKLIEKFPGYRIIGQAAGYVEINGVTCYAIVCLLYVTQKRHTKA